MNYYERHLGDYAKDTAHLSMLEHGAYSLLLDRYYSTEAGIPEGQAHRVARARGRDEKQAVDAVLSEFFTLSDGVWINQRAEEEIEKARVRISAAKENGKKGGRPRKEKETQQKPSGFSGDRAADTGNGGFSQKNIAAAAHQKEKPNYAEIEKNPLGINESNKPDGFSVGSDLETQSKAHHVPSTSKHSEAKASGGEPPKVTDPEEIIFGYGVPLLTNAGTAEKQARSFLGGLRKNHGDAVLIDKLRDCLKARPLQPLEWLAAAMPPPATSGSRPGRTPAAENFATKNYGTGGLL